MLCAFAATHTDAKKKNSVAFEILCSAGGAEAHSHSHSEKVVPLKEGGAGAHLVKSAAKAQARKQMSKARSLVQT